MSEDRHCHECGGNDGLHYHGCTYEGTDGERVSISSGGGNVSVGKWWIGYVIALVIGYGINEFLGVIIMLVLIFWLIVS